MKKLYLSILCLMTARIAFGMDNNNNNNEDRAGRKRSHQETESYSVKAFKVMDGDSDDEESQPTSHDQFQKKIQDRLEKAELYSARVSLQAWIIFSTKDKPNLVYPHLTSMWSIYRTLEADMAAKGHKLNMIRSISAPLTRLTDSCQANHNNNVNT